MYTKIVQSGDVLTVTSYEYEPYSVSNRGKSRKREARKGHKRPSLRRSDNLRQCRARLLGIIRSTLFSLGKPSFVTLTFRELLSVAESYEHFTKFSQRLRKLYGESLAYVGVVEFQSSGRVHFHVLFWGFSDIEILMERQTRRLARIWSHGFLDIVPTDGSMALAGYFTKYMTKALFDDRLIGKKAYTTSRNICRPYSVSISGSLDDFPELKSELLDVDNLPVHVSSFSTQWLGRANYSRYNISS